MLETKTAGISDGIQITKLITDIAQKAKSASNVLAKASSNSKDQALLLMSSGILSRSSFIIEENNKDIEDSKAKGISTSFLDRLTLTPSRIKAMADGLKEIASLHDPVGEVVKMWRWLRKSLLMQKYSDLAFVMQWRHFSYMRRLLGPFFLL